MLDFLRRLLVFDNLVAVFAAALAIVLAIISIFSDHISTAGMLEGIMSVLAFLLVTLVIERETRLKRFADELSEFRGEYHRYHQPFLKSRSDLEAFSDYIKEADELFYTGGHASSLLTVEYNTLKTWLIKGRKFKIILQDPKNFALDHVVMPCSNYSADSYRKQIELTLAQLEKLSNVAEGEVEIRLTDVTPSNSVTILNGHRGGPVITVLMHVPDGDSGTSPFMRITQVEHSVWHRLFFERYYRFLWEKSRRLER